MKVQPSHKSPIRHPVFFLSSALAMLMIIGTLLSPDSASTFIDSTKTSIISSFDSLFAIICNLIVILCLAIMVSPWGNIRLGGSQAEPEFSTLSWLSMLFAAGMGIGLMFWSVAEPAAYYTGWFGTPLNVLKSTEEAAWFCGEDFDYFKRLFEQLPSHTQKQTQILMILSEDCDLTLIKNIASQQGFLFKKRSERVIKGEPNFIFSIQRN
jgi:predicted DNA binding CopG/RHH family protein